MAGDLGIESSKLSPQRMAAVYVAAHTPSARTTITDMGAEGIALTKALTAPRRVVNVRCSESDRRGANRVIFRLLDRRLIHVKLFRPKKFYGWRSTVAPLIDLRHLTREGCNDLVVPCSFGAHYHEFNFDWLRAQPTNTTAPSKRMELADGMLLPAWAPFGILRGEPGPGKGAHLFLTIIRGAFRSEDETIPQPIRDELRGARNLEAVLPSGYEMNFDIWRLEEWTMPTLSAVTHAP